MRRQSSWVSSGAPRGDDYEAQFAARLGGENPHGEADFVENLLQRVSGNRHEKTVICDGGCGTGRVAIELARRGYPVVGVDNDPEMLAVARRKAPELLWRLGDLASVEFDVRLAAVVLAGNVMIFVEPGREQLVLQNLARYLTRDGVVIAGFQLGTGRIGLDEYDRLARTAGLYLLERWATWDRQPWHSSADYAVSVHQQRLHE